MDYSRPKRLFGLLRSTLPAVSLELGENDKNIIVVFRFVLFLALAFFLLYNPRKDGDISLIPLFLLGAYLASDVVLFFLSEQRVTKMIMQGAILIFDTLLISLIIYIANDWDVDFYLIYFLILFVSGIQLRLWQSFLLTGSIACFIYAWYVIENARQGRLLDFFNDPATPEIYTISFIAALRSEKVYLKEKRMETQMRQSEKLAAVGELAAGIAHEINNPLTVILGFAQSLIKKMPEAESFSMPLKSIERETLRCKQLVSDLLLFTRADKGQKDIFALNTIVAAMLGLIEAQARMKSIEIVKELGPLEMISGNKNLIQQVVVNLCNNAMDAMPPQGGRVTVRTHAGEGTTKSAVILEVEDTGSGMTHEVQERIFDPFFTTKEVGHGTGLGLSLVHQIVMQHQGTISVKSEPGRGSLFTVSLPISKELYEPKRPS